MRNKTSSLETEVLALRKQVAELKKLIPKPKKHEGFVAVYRYGERGIEFGGNLHPGKAQILQNSCRSERIVAIVPISFTEGDGLTA